MTKDPRYNISDWLQSTYGKEISDCINVNLEKSSGSGIQEGESFDVIEWVKGKCKKPLTEGEKNYLSDYIGKLGSSMGKSLFCHNLAEYIIKHYPKQKGESK